MSLRLSPLERLQADDSGVRWTRTDMPDFDGAKVHVLPGAFSGSIIELMMECGMTGASLDDADLVVFAGGADIDPQLYGQKALSCTHFSPRRDSVEVDAYAKTLKRGVPMFGICRGQQFLAAMNGAKLWQDVNNHAGRDHDIYDLLSGVRLTVTSLHHQMVQYDPKMTLVAIAAKQIATSFRDDTTKMNLTGSLELGQEIEVEAGAYDKTKCFFVQGHPEIGSPEYRSWTCHTLKDFIIDWEPMYSLPLPPSIKPKQAI